MIVTDIWSMVSNTDYSMEFDSLVIVLVLILRLIVLWERDTTSGKTLKNILELKPNISSPLMQVSFEFCLSLFRQHIDHE